MWVANTRLRLQGIKWKPVESKASNATDVSKTHYNGLIGEIDLLYCCYLFCTTLQFFFTVCRHSVFNCILRLFGPRWTFFSVTFTFSAVHKFMRVVLMLEFSAFVRFHIKETTYLLTYNKMNSNNHSVMQIEEINKTMSCWKHRGASFMRTK